MMWLLRSSPLDVRTLFLTKYWVGTVPLLLVALPLIVATNIILEASPLVLGITTIAMIGATFAITALALGFGALYPNYDTQNVAEIPTSFGGLVFMMAAVSYLAGVVILLAWPVSDLLQARFQQEATSIVPLTMARTTTANFSNRALFCSPAKGTAFNSFCASVPPSRSRKNSR